MKICHIKDSYIDYLRNNESKVLGNKKESRPYVGVVLKINNMEYYVPLTSPKPKHLSMKNTKDFHKIKGGVYGAINFNNMVPVPKNCLIDFDFKNITDIKYKNLLINQYNEIKKIEKTITKKARELHNLYNTKEEDLTDNDKAVKNRCCDFPLLEQLCNNYNPQISTNNTK